VDDVLSISVYDAPDVSASTASGQLGSLSYRCLARLWKPLG